MKVESLLLFTTLVIIGNGYRADGYRPGTAFCYPEPRHLPLLSCVSRCHMTNGRTYWVHHDGVPCFQTNARGKPIGSPGICKAGKCIRHDELGEPEFGAAARQIFSEKYHRCKDKDNSSKIVLSDCHYYCETDGGLFFGHYGNGTNNSCFLFDRAEPQRLGWCCRGKCNREPHCKGAEILRSE
uniref:Putative secreted protein n=1 Tax=Amblyomma cajennense TaxID=34607 RepID=A0A023FRS9_AMBCJ